MTGIRAVFLIGTTMLAGCAVAYRPSEPFLERMYVGVAPRDTSIMYEAQVATHVFLADGLADAYEKISLDSTAEHADAWRLILTPMFRIRQLKDSSSAVRTPSFMPRLSVEWLRATRLGRIGAGPVVSYGWANLTGVRLTLAHHSNGQAGCFREGFKPADIHANQCVPIPGADTSMVRINRANGDFSSTFVNLTVHTTLMNRSGNDEPTRSVGAAGGFDWHVPGLFGQLSPEQRSLYGSWRLHAAIEGALRSGVSCHDAATRPWYASTACLFAGRSRVTLDGERAPRYPGDLARRIQPEVLPYRWSVELSHAIDGALGIGPFLRWHDGQDYYNINFVHRRKVFMWGIMMDLGGYDHLGGRLH